MLEVESSIHFSIILTRFGEQPSDLIERSRTQISLIEGREHLCEYFRMIKRLSAKKELTLVEFMNQRIDKSVFSFHWRKIVRNAV